MKYIGFSSSTESLHLFQLLPTGSNKMAEEATSNTLRRLCHRQICKACSVSTAIQHKFEKKGV